MPKITDEDLLGLSPEVLSSLIDAAMERKDFETVRLTVTETAKLGKVIIDIIEKLMLQSLAIKDFSTLTFFLTITSTNKLTLSEAVYKKCLKSYVSYLKWDEAAICIKHMIESKHPIEDKALFFTLGGLMRSSESVSLSLDLIAMIYDHQREALGDYISFSKVEKFAQAQSASRGKEGTGRSVPSVDSLKRAVESSLTALGAGRFSFSLTKALVALACGSGHSEIAADYIRRVVAGTAVQPDLDLLSVLRALSQAAGLYGAAELAPLLLRLVVEHMPRAGLCEGPRECMDLLKMYWVLCHLTVLAKDAKRVVVPSAELADVHSRLEQFARDAYKSDVTLSLPRGADRRNARILCDEFGLTHKIGSETNEVPHADGGDVKPSMFYSRSAAPAPVRTEVLRIQKGVREGSARRRDTPPLSDILGRDAKRADRRKLEGRMPHWDRVLPLLAALDPELLKMVVVNVTYSMRSYASAAWTLDFLQLLIDKQIEVPPVLVTNAIEMCARRHDVYSLLEVFRMASSLGLRLSNGDWNRACLAAWNTGTGEMPPQAFRDAFLEVLGCMQESGAELQEDTQRTLLRFLVHTEPRGDSTWRVLRRLYRDKALQVGHVECTALSLILMSLLPLIPYDAICIARPRYRSENYLFVYPKAIAQILKSMDSAQEQLGEEFARSFDRHWADVSSHAGRVALYSQVMDTLSVSGQRGSLTSTDKAAAREALGLLSLYVAYLIGAQDGDFRRAYDLLYACASVVREAEERRVSTVEADEAKGEEWS